VSFRPSEACGEIPKAYALTRGDFDAIDATRNNTLFRRFAPYGYARNDNRTNIEMCHAEARRSI